MKKNLLPCLLCVIFLLTAFSISGVYAFPEEQMEFYYNGRIFNYSLRDNIKTSSQFDLNFEINKYNRFGSKEERINLLSHMISSGIDKQIALEYLFPNLSKTLNTIKKNVYIPARNARLKINPNAKTVFKVTPEIVGVSLDIDTLINQIYLSYINQNTLCFPIPIQTTVPKETGRDFEKFINLRSDFSTEISSSSADRKHNIKNALQSLNKIEVLPNEVFSFNKTVGRRTAENGYRQAKIIVNNEFVEGIGGGVCQVSSTLYNSALLAGLEIIEANKHSKQVSYVKPGLDAMVNFGSSDLKFKNNTSEKITIITNFSPNQIRIRIYGQDPKTTTYKITNEIFNICEPNEEILIDEKREHIEKVRFEDQFFYLKKASRGMEIKSYREKYVNNTLVSKELLRHDKFKVQNAIKIYGAEKREKSTEQVCASIIPFHSLDTHNQHMLPKKY